MTVITQADFDFSDNNNVAGISPGGAQGDAALYVSGGGSLPDPPSGAGTEGDYCRSFEIPNGAVVFGTRVSTRPWIKASVESGVFHGAQPTNQAYSLRAWIRLDTTGRHSRVGFAMRTDPTVFFTASGGSGFSGYGITVGNMNPDGFSSGSNISGWVHQPTGQSSTIPDVNVAYTFGNWVKVRMDVLHLATIQDTVTFYTGTGATGSEVWTQIGQSVVPIGSNGYNAPSLATNRTCFVFDGSGTTGGTPSQQNYIDRFQAIMSIAS